MDKIAPIKERILYFIENQNITKSSFCKNTDISYSNLKGKSLFSEIGGEYLSKIVNFYTDISPLWLLTGEGSMLKSGDTTEVSAQVGNNCIYGSFSGRDIKNSTVGGDSSKDAIIDFLKGIIEQKDKQIIQKDEQIKTLLDLMKNKQ